MKPNLPDPPKIHRIAPNPLHRSTIRETLALDTLFFVSMWQFLLVAAVAGFVSSRLRAAKASVASAGGIVGKGTEKWDRKDLEQVSSGSDLSKGEGRVGSVECQVSSPTDLPNGEGIFRFSSSGFRLGSGKLGKKGGYGFGGIVRSEKKSRSVRFGVVQRKCGLCHFKGGCSFGLGLGVGMMFMISARKSDISKLCSSMEEAEKNVMELKPEIRKRKSSGVEVQTNAAKCDGQHSLLESNMSSTKNKEEDDIKFSSLPAEDYGECPSSVLTDDQEPELLEIDQLEAELVLELQKLPWCTADDSQPDGMRQNLHSDSDSYQFHGINPSELEQKLSHLLIEQQENQIIELELELQMIQMKLDDKESELQALKNCIRRLTEPSLSTVTDEESEAQDWSTLELL